jgi:hypothetical protein
MVVILQKHNVHYTGQQMCIIATMQTAKRLTFTEPMFAHVKAHKKNHPAKSILYIRATMKFTALLRQSA